MTGMLVFVSQGSASQIVIAMIFSFVSFGVYLRFAPFVKDEDDVVAITAQFSVFFTLFSSLLIKVNVDNEDGYDQEWLGALMILLNLLAVIATVGYWLVVPIRRLAKALSKKHVHDGELKGLGESQLSKDNFLAYFERLCLSSEEEAGWEKISAKYFGKDKADGEQWMKDKRATCEWRCSTGDGPIDTYRVKFFTDSPMENVIVSVMNIKHKSKTTIQQLVVGKNADEGDEIYLAVRMPLIFSNRDFLVQRYDERDRNDGSFITASRR